MEKNFKEILKEIKAFAFDVDGVFTNCKIIITADGDFIREFNMRDGLAVVRAIKKGYPIAIISSGQGKQLEKRMEMLGIKHLYLQSTDKGESLKQFARENSISTDSIVFMGDDYPDIAAMKACHMGVAPADAISSVKEVAAYTSLFKGGEGCVRDIIEQVLRVHGDWFE